MGRRGFSLVELLVVVTLTSMAIGVTVALYGYSINRLAKSAASYAAMDQARKLHDEIEAVVRDSVGCTIVTTAQGTALKCILAYQSNRALTTADLKDGKLAQAASPVSVTKRGYEKHGAGKRVWFYLANSAGTFGTLGTTVWRAERTDDSTPIPTDNVITWTCFPGTSKLRFDLITDLTFAVNTAIRTVNVTISARSLWRDERTGVSLDKSSQTFTETRTTGWRNWFQ